jgi:hypothetical protein
MGQVKGEEKKAEFIRMGAQLKFSLVFSSPVRGFPSTIHVLCYCKPRYGSAFALSSKQNALHVGSRM